MSDLKIQGVVEMSSEGAERALDRVADKAGQMSSRLEKEAGKAGKAVDSIADGAGKSADEFNRAEGKIVASIKRATTQLEQLGKTASQKLELRISERGLDPARFEPMLGKLRELELAQARATAGSAAMAAGYGGQFSNNVRNASFQIQDFAVQVNGGVDATKALAMQLPQMLVGFGTAGAVIGVVAALLPNIVQMFGSTAGASKTLGDAMSDFNKSTSAVGETVKKFDMQGLYEEFNKADAATKKSIVSQIEFQKAFIETQRVVAAKKFGESISGFTDDSQWGRLSKTFTSSAVTMTSGWSDIVASDLGIRGDLAKALIPALESVKRGTKDASEVFDQFGRKLLEGNPKAIELAKSLSEMAKTERDAASASDALTEAHMKMAGGHIQTRKEAEEAARGTKALAKEQAALADLLNTINAKDTGFDANYVKNVELLLGAYGKGKLSLDAFNDAFGRYVAMQPGAVAAKKAQTQAEEDYIKALSASIDPLEKQASTLEREVMFYGMTESAIQNTLVARLEEARAIQEANGVLPDHLALLDREIELRKRIATASSQKEFLDTNKRAAEASAREWEKFADDINRSLTDALFRAFESGSGFGKSFADTLGNTLKAAVAKALINVAITTGSNALNTGINALLGTSGANGGSGTNYLGLASNASSMYNLANGSYAAAAANAYSYGSTALGYTYGTSALSQQSMMLAAQESGIAGSTSSLSGLSAGTVAWVAAIVMGMYMSSQAWKAGIKWGDFADDYRKTDMYKFDGAAQTRDLMEEPARAILGDDIVDSEFWAIAFGSSLSAQIHEAFVTATGNYGAPKTNFNTRFSANAVTGITANPMENGSTAYAGGQESLSNAIFNNAVRLAVMRFSPTDAFDVTLAGHINNRGRSSNQKLSEVIQDGDTIYRHRAESGKGMADFQSYTNDAIPKMQLAIIAEAMRDSSADYKGVVDMVLGTSKDLTDAIRDMSAWRVGNTLQDLFAIADAFDQVKTGLSGLPIKFSDLAAVAENARNSAAVAVSNVEAQIASATAAGDTAAVKTLTEQLAGLKAAAAETDAAAVTRVIRETQAFTGVLDLMGKSLSEVFDASNSSKIFALSEALVGVFGTVDALAAAVNGYIDNFYSAEEKRAQQIENIQKRLAQAGLNFSAEEIDNATRDQFRAVVEAVKLTGEQGIVAFKALMDVQSAFSELHPVIDATAEAAKIAAAEAEALARANQAAAESAAAWAAEISASLLAGIDSQQAAAFAAAEAGMAQLQRAVDLERERASAARQAAQEQITLIESLTGYLDDQIAGLIGGTGAGQGAAGAFEFIAQAAANAVAGYLPEQAALAEAVTAARGNLSRTAYASAAERDLATLKLAGQLAQIKDAGAKQLPVAERALGVADEQLKAAEKALDYYRTQIDELRGVRSAAIDLSMGVDAAGKAIVVALGSQLAGLGATIMSALASGKIGSADAAQRLTAAGVPTDTVTLVGGKPTYVSSQGAIATSDGMITANTGARVSIDDARKIVAEAFYAMPAEDFYTAAKKVGLSSSMIDGLYNLPGGTALAWAKSQGLPAFAAGTNRVPADMLAILHKDEAVVPAAFNPWAGGNMQSGGDDRLVRLVDALTGEVRRLQAIVAEGNRHAERTAVVLDDAAKGRNPITTEAAA